AGGGAALIADFATNGERLLEAAESVVEFVQRVVSDADAIECRGLIAIIASLNGEIVGSVQILQPALRIATASEHSAQGEERAGRLRIALKEVVVVLAGLVEGTHAVINAAESELNFGVLGGGLCELLVIVDGFLIVVRKASVISDYQVALASGKVCAKVFAFPGGLLGFGIATERGVGLRELRVCESKVGIFLDRGLKTGESVSVVSLTGQVQTFVVDAKGFDRLRVGAERLGLKFLGDIG